MFYYKILFSWFNANMFLKENQWLGGLYILFAEGLIGLLLFFINQLLNVGISALRTE